MQLCPSRISGITVIKTTFWKEEKYVKFFERVKDTIEEDGNIVLKPYFEFYYNRKRNRSNDQFCLQVRDIKNKEFEMTLGMFVDDLISKSKPIDWNSHFQQCIKAIRWMDPVLSEFKKTS